MLPLIIAQYEFLIQLCHCHVIRIIHNTDRSVCGRLQQSFQNKPAYFNYHPVGLIIAVILDVPVDVMSVQSIYGIEEDKQLMDFFLPRLGNICTEQESHCRFDNAICIGINRKLIIGADELFFTKDLGFDGFSNFKLASWGSQRLFLCYVLST